MAAGSPKMLSFWLQTFFFFLHLFVCDLECLISSVLGFKLSFHECPSTQDSFLVSASHYTRCFNACHRVGTPHEFLTC